MRDIKKQYKLNKEKSKFVLAGLKRNMEILNPNIYDLELKYGQCSQWLDVDANGEFMEIE